MLRHLLSYIPDVAIARDLRGLLEDDTTIVICGPDRAVALGFLTLACGHRMPNAHRVVLRTEAQQADLRLEGYEDFTVRTVSDDASIHAGFRSAFRMDPDGIVVADLPDSCVEMFAMAIQTGHTIGSAVIAQHDDIGSTVAAWVAALGGWPVAGVVLAPVVFIELAAAGQRPLIRSVAGIASDGGTGTVMPRYRWREFPFIPGRDTDLEQRYRRAQGAAYTRHLATGEPRETGTTAPERLVSTAELAEWSRQTEQLAGTASIAYIPVCAAVTEAEKTALHGVMEMAAWPRSPAGRPAFLVAGFTPPDGGCGPLAAGERFELYLADPDQDDGEDGGFTVVVTSAAAPVGDLLREHYQIRTWIPSADRPLAEGDDDEAAGCYHGNKLLGSPCWIQGDATPACPACGRPMTLFLQLDGEGGELSNLWGDARLFVFSCTCKPGTWKTIRQYS